MPTYVRTVILSVLLVIGLASCGGCGGMKAPDVQPPSLGNGPSLSMLSISAGVFDQIFQSGVMTYSSSVDFLTSSTTVTPTAANPNATVTVNGANVLSGTSSQSIDLIEGDNNITVLVTAEDDITTQTYEITVARIASTAFAQQAYIKSASTTAEERLGWSIALEGDTLAVGKINKGSVYIFTRDGAGMWSEQQKITGSIDDSFGYRLALSGDTLAITARYDALMGRASGATYIYVRDAVGNWIQQAYLHASNPDEQDNFGVEVALHGDTLAVGARDDSSSTGINGNQADNSAENSGAVYVFTRDATDAWTQQAYIKASNTEAGDRFGHSGLAIFDNTLAVGAHIEDSGSAGINGDQQDNSVPSAGAAYVFARDNLGTWSQQAYIKASDPGNSAAFGAALSLDSNTLAVGGPANSVNNGGGAAYVFVRDNAGTWTQQAVIPSPDTISTWLLGWEVALSGNMLAVSDPQERSDSVGIDGDSANTNAPASGAVYVFERDFSGTWSQIAYIKPSNTDADDEFGYSLAISGDSIAVGARYESSSWTGINGNQANNDAVRSGAVYVFQ